MATSGDQNLAVDRLRARLRRARAGPSHAKSSCLRVLAICGLSLTLSACTVKYTPLYLQGSAAQPQAMWRACASKQGITDLALYSGTSYNPAHRTPLWQIKAIGDAKTESVVLGQTPPGFQSIVPLTQPLQQGQSYALLANQSSRFVSGDLIFKPQELRPGFVVFSDTIVEESGKYDHRPNRDFCG